LDHTGGLLALAQHTLQDSWYSGVFSVQDSMSLHSFFPQDFLRFVLLGSWLESSTGRNFLVFILSARSVIDIELGVTAGVG